MNAKRDRSTAIVLGAVIVGMIGAFGLAVCVLVAGHGLLLAFLAYAVGGMTLTIATVAGRLAVDAAAARAAHRPGHERATRAA